ncbi:alpha/beta hydrolase family protein [Myroides sp. LJL110]
MKLVIKIFLTFTAFFCLLTTYGNNEEYISDLWHNIVPIKISPDGEWLLYYKRYPTSGKNEIHLINIRTNVDKNITDRNLKSIELLRSDVLIGIDANTGFLTSTNLKNDVVRIINQKIKSFDIDIKTNYLHVLDSNKNLITYKINSNTIEQKNLANNVSSYYLNYNKTLLIYQDEDFNLYSINLTTFNTKLLKKQEKTIVDLKWNNSGDHFYWLDYKNKINICNTKTFEIREIPLIIPDIKDFSISFSDNNDMLIEYTETTNTSYPESTYLDILQGNNRSSFPNNFQKKYIKKYFAFYYTYKTDKLQKLNKNFAIQYEPLQIPDILIFADRLDSQDFLSTSLRKKYYLKNVTEKDSIFLTRSPEMSPYRLYISNNNNYILYPKDNASTWEIYSIKDNSKFTINTYSENKLMIPVWSEDSKYIFYQQGNNLVKINISSKKNYIIHRFNAPIIIKPINTQKTKHSVLKVYVDTRKDILFEVSINNKKALYNYSADNFTKIRDFTSNHITFLQSLELSQNPSNTFIWTEENFNLPKRIMYAKGNQVNFLRKSDIPDSLYSWNKQKIIKFKDKYEKELDAVLFYPKNYSSLEKYPLVIELYEGIWTSSVLRPNEFKIPTLVNSNGFNRALLNELGYFVLYVDNYVSKDGPGLTAVDCTIKAIQEVVNYEKSIDQSKIGLSGHSFGGYKASFIATQTDIFTAVISFAGRHDILPYTYSDNHLRYPEYARMEKESSQYKFKESFGENPKKYNANSTIQHAHKITTPILLVTGNQDYNVPWEQTRTLYWALKRYNKAQTIALIYNKVGHQFNLASEQRTLAKEYTKRYIEWFDYFLKGKKDIKWIDEAVTPDKYTWSPR